MGFFVVALEEDLEKKRSNLVSMLSIEPENETGNVAATKFGKVWKASLKVEEITLIYSGRGGNSDQVDFSCSSIKLFPPLFVRYSSAYFQSSQHY